MGVYRAEVDVPLSPDRVYDLLVDVVRAPQWVEGLLRVVDATGHSTVPGATVRLDYGPGFKRRATVLTARRGEIYRVHQVGARVEDTFTVKLSKSRDGAATHLSMEMDLQFRLGPLSRLYEHRWLGRAKIEKQLNKHLARFVEFAARKLAEARPGTCYSVDCGDGFRVVQVISANANVVHVRLLPDSAKHRPTDARPFLEQADALELDPRILRRVRIPDESWARVKESIVVGQPLLALDDGLGVPHFAMTGETFSDALPEPIGEFDIPATARVEVESWTEADGPLAGRDIAFDVWPLLALPIDAEWAVAKVLARSRKVVHLRIYSDRWKDLPDFIDPWRLRLDPAWAQTPGIGHVPMAMSDLESWGFFQLRLVMVGDDELDGYRTWKESGGGVFQMPSDRRDSEGEDRPGPEPS